jgi:5-methylcytosine-specific restriction enzyme subunit McrC
MGLLFEAFVRNFLRREQDVFRVGATKVPWDVDPVAGADIEWLPEMRTDLMLLTPSHRIVVETKYYASPYQVHYGTKKLISGHLYQLLTYLSQVRAVSGPTPIGVLLYAGVGDDQRLEYRIGGHTVLVRGLDLNRDWRDIRRSLLTLGRELEDRAEEAAVA